MTLHIPRLLLIVPLVLAGCEDSDTDEVYVEPVVPQQTIDFDAIDALGLSDFRPGQGGNGGGDVTAYSYESGGTYALDADVSDRTVDRLYFSNGGNVDLYGCELDQDGRADCQDEEGRYWDIEGEPDSIEDDGIGYDDNGVYGYDEDGDGSVDEEW